LVCLHELGLKVAVVRFYFAAELDIKAAVVLFYFAAELDVERLCVLWHVLRRRLLHAPDLPVSQKRPRRLGGRLRGWRLGRGGRSCFVRVGCAVDEGDPVERLWRRLGLGDGRSGSVLHVCGGVRMGGWVETVFYGVFYFGNYNFFIFFTVTFELNGFQIFVAWKLSKNLKILFFGEEVV
jgi:hypothetical protein